MGPQPPHLPGKRPTTQRPSRTYPLIYPGLESVQKNWHKGIPLYARAGIHVHLVHHLSIPGRLSVYDDVGDGWQLNVITAHVPSGDAKEPLPQALARPHHHPRQHERRPKPSTPRWASHSPARCSLRRYRNARARGHDGQPRRPTIPLPPPNDVCYGEPTTVIRAVTRYGTLPLGLTGHTAPHILLTFPNLPPSPPEDADQGLPLPL